MIEITKLRVTGVGTLPRLALPRAAEGERAPMPRERRAVWIDAAAGWRETPIYTGAALAANDEIDGPAIVDEATTTVLIGTGDRLRVDAAGNFAIMLRGARP